MFDMFGFIGFDPLPEEEVEVSRKFIKLLLDFGKDGKVNEFPNWAPLHLDDPRYLEIDREFEVKSGMPLQNRMEFWQKLNVYWNYTTSSKYLETYHDEL